MRNINYKLALAGCNPESEIYNLDSLAGVLAQLVERLNGIAASTVFPFVLVRSDPRFHI
jgi:hypothetical protein